MAIFKAEDISVGINGVEFPATQISFNSAYSYAEDRRLGAPVGGDAFLESGPRRTSFSVDFYVTGVAELTNPVFQLLSGEDIVFLDDNDAPIDPDVGTMRPHVGLTGDLVWMGLGDYHSAKILYDWDSDSWLYTGTNGVELYGDIIQSDRPWGDGGGFETDGYFVNRTGHMGALTGSSIQLGGQYFADGAALTDLSLSISPFAPIICSAKFDIYNKVTGTFPSGSTSQIIDPNEVAHGMYSSYSGVTGISEMGSISLQFSAERAPRYSLGSDAVQIIKTAKATKQVSFEGWGQSTPILEDAPSSLVITLGSANNSNMFTTLITGATMDDSFDLPTVGIMSKRFKITQNLV